MKFLFTIIVFIYLATPILAIDENVGILATVNGTPLTLGDVMEVSASGESQLAVIYKGRDLDKQIWKLRKEILETLIDRKLIYQDFKDHEFKLPRDFLENNMDLLLKSFHLNTREELESILIEKGKTMDEFKDKIYENIAVDALIYGHCYREVFITPQVVYDYYQSNKNQFTSEAMIKFRILTLKKKGVHAQDYLPLSKYLEKKLKGKGETEFVDTVSLYSDGPNLDVGGEVNYIKVKDIRKEFAAVIDKYKVGEIYGPIDTDEAVYFFYIQKFKESHTLPYEDAKLEIREKMLNETKQKAYKSYVGFLRKGAYVQYFI